MGLVETAQETVAETIQCIGQTHAIGISNSQPTGEFPSSRASSHSLGRPYWDRCTVEGLVAIIDGFEPWCVTKRLTFLSIDSKQELWSVVQSQPVRSTLSPAAADAAKAYGGTGNWSRLEIQQLDD